MSDVGQFEIRTLATIRDGILRVIRNGLIARGVADPNVGPNSDYFITATALASELVVGEANAVIKADACMPDTATGDELKRWLTTCGLKFRSAVGSVGNVSMQATAASPVVLGAQLLDSAGLTFEVTKAGTYNDGDAVPVQGFSTGYATNHLNGDILTWISPPAFAKPTVTVGQVGGTDGLTDGVDAEDEETARARLLDRLANPPAAGNWQHCAEIAEESSPTVQKAFPYPALGGPSTVHIAVVGYSTAPISDTITGPNANRDINATIVSATIAPYIKGILPEYVDVTVTTVANVPADVSIGLSLPSAPNASPAGPGGGWLDGTPWPVVGGTTGYTFAAVTAVTSTTRFTVDAPSPPQAGVSRIAFLNTSTWTIYSCLVTSFTGSGPYDLRVDTPLLSIGVGDYVWPQSVNQAAYAKALLTAFAQMGPGEKTANATILDRSYRHPTPQQRWPYSLGAQQLRALSNVGEEVLDTSWLYRSTTTPAVSATISDPPNILVPRHVGFYSL